MVDCASFAEASDDDRLIWHTDQGRHVFDYTDLVSRGFQQSDYLNEDFLDEFQVLRDLTPTRLVDFLDRYPSNRNALLRYIVELPSDVIRDGHRISLLAAITDFHPQRDQNSRPPASATYLAISGVKSKPFVNRVPLKFNKHEANEGEPRQRHRFFFKPYPLRLQSGFDYRFHRGLLVEYQFDAPALLRFDVRRQRFELQWDFD